MILSGIMENDLDSCSIAINSDKRLNELDKEFNRLLDQVDTFLKMELEEVYSSCNSRVMRIGYLQGVKDFYELCIVLKEDTDKLIKRLNKIL